jgi:hypothetical protein
MRLLNIKVMTRALDGFNTARLEEMYLIRAEANAELNLLDFKCKLI